ncbi:MAG: hypothetical protein LBK72_07135 [Bifidobacteriaceae bacterium]|nr:hypothetical protein [Bifidobacteriaceae bacterium]
MTETSWGTSWAAPTSTSHLASQRADTVAAKRAAEDVYAGAAHLSAARPVEWVAPSVAVYLERLRELRDAAGTAHDMIDTVRYRATVFNQLLESEPARVAGAEE